ncbi:MAG: ABC transporter ATP-binding protein [Actinomycetota bacterium]
MIQAVQTRGTDAAQLPGASAVEVRGLSKRFGAAPAVDNVELVLEPGDFLTLVGPSGCGKSTLLRMIAGLIEPDLGEVALAGKKVFAPGVWVPPEERAVGLVFQENTLFPHLSVAANVSFGLKRLEAATRDRRIAEVLELVDLPGYGSRFPHELSGGERQRVALARALAPAPTVLLLDEPFANLDPNLRSQVRSQTVQILRRAGASVLFVTHDQQEAMSVGDRVAVMRGGRIEQIGPPKEVFHLPCNRFVASSLGEAYFLRAHLSEGGFLTTEIGTCECAREVPAGQIEIMVRPHDVSFDLHSEANAEVVGVEFQGAVILYDVQMPSGRMVRCQLPHTVDVELGTPVRVKLAHGHDPVILPVSS